jgi:pheromone shutdown-related protein TraB
MNESPDAGGAPAAPPDALPSALEGQPIVEMQRDGTHYTLLGTAHVSRSSVDAVEALIASRDFDAVAVELCEGRYSAMLEPDTLSRLDLFRVIREGKTGLVAANLALSAYQRRLAEQLGVEPGAEMRAAMDAARARATPVWRIDRDVGTTLRRTHASVGFWQKMMLSGGLVASLFADEKVEEEEIEKLKQGDLLESAFHEFATRSEPLYRSLIAERDRYMAAALRQHAAESSPGRVLAVVGAGHLEGLAKHLAEDEAPPAGVRADLDRLPPPGRWGTWITILVIALVLGGFVYGFSQGVDVGTDLVWRWILTTGLLGALGCAIAGGHPLSILAAFVASPLTPLHPALSSGMASALVEAWVRRPTVADFARLREDVTSPRGWWRNRVARVLLNFFLTSFGTAAGVWLAGWRMLERLF